MFCYQPTNTLMIHIRDQDNDCDLLDRHHALPCHSNCISHFDTHLREPSMQVYIPCIDPSSVHLRIPIARKKQMAHALDIATCPLEISIKIALRRSHIKQKLKGLMTISQQLFHIHNCLCCLYKHSINRVTIFSLSELSISGANASRTVRPRGSI